MKHTPGPWFIAPCTHGIKGTGGDNWEVVAFGNANRRIAICTDSKRYGDADREAIKANVTLIAAAPEMYEALIDALDEACRDNKNQKLINTLNDAIAKAEYTESSNL